MGRVTALRAAQAAHLLGGNAIRHQAEHLYVGQALAPLVPGTLHAQAWGDAQRCPRPVPGAEGCLQQAHRRGGGRLRASAFCRCQSIWQGRGAGEPLSAQDLQSMSCSHSHASCPGPASRASPAARPLSRMALRGRWTWQGQHMHVPAALGSSANSMRHCFKPTSHICIQGALCLLSFTPLQLCGPHYCIIMTWPAPSLCWRAVCIEPRVHALPHPTQGCSQSSPATQGSPSCQNAVSSPISSYLRSGLGSRRPYLCSRGCNGTGCVLVCRQRRGPEPQGER